MVIRFALLGMIADVSEAFADNGYEHTHTDENDEKNE